MYNILAIMINGLVMVRWVWMRKDIFLN